MIKFVLDRLLASLAQCQGIGEASIIVVIGGCPTETTETTGNTTTLYVTYNALDFTALIAVLNRTHDDEYFYLHDTCVVDPDFLDRVADLPPNTPLSIGLKKSWACTQRT